MKFEYGVKDLTVSPAGDRDELKRLLDELGEDEWEVVALSAAGPTPSGASQYRAILKRARHHDGFGAAGMSSAEEV